MPGSVWGLVDNMLPFMAQLQPMGSRIEVAHLRDQAQLQQRASLAAHSACMAAFAAGIHALDRYCSILRSASQSQHAL